MWSRAYLSVVRRSWSRLLFICKDLFTLGISVTFTRTILSLLTFLSFHELTFLRIYSISFLLNLFYFLFDKEAATRVPPRCAFLKNFLSNALLELMPFQNLLLNRSPLDSFVFHGASGENDSLLELERLYIHLSDLRVSAFVVDKKTRFRVFFFLYR